MTLYSAWVRTPLPSPTFSFKEYCMKFKPVYNKIVIEPVVRANEEKKSTIIMIDKPDPFKRGRVLAVGQGMYQNGERIEMDIKVGDIVVFGPASGIPLEFDSTEKYELVRMLADQDVLAIEVPEEGDEYITEQEKAKRDEAEGVSMNDLIK